MKYQKLFYGVCALVFGITVGFVTLVILSIANVIEISSWTLFVFCIFLLIMLFLSFCCGFILLSIYDDWKWRHVDKNGKWKK